MTAGCAWECVDLTALRESKGISLEEIARSTRITLRCLQAIERADFEALPGAFYASSYLRQYAAAVGLDPSVLLDAYRRHQAEQPASDGPQPRKSIGPFQHILLWLRHYRVV